MKDVLGEVIDDTLQCPFHGFRFSVPIATLEPGSYLLTFEASTPAAAQTPKRGDVPPTSRRDIRFVINPDKTK